MSLDHLSTVEAGHVFIKSIVGGLDEKFPDRIGGVNTLYTYYTGPVVPAAFKRVKANGTPIFARLPTLSAGIALVEEFHGLGLAAITSGPSGSPGGDGKSYK